MSNTKGRGKKVMFDKTGERSVHSSGHGCDCIPSRAKKQQHKNPDTPSTSLPKYYGAWWKHGIIFRGGGMEKTTPVYGQHSFCPLPAPGGSCVWVARCPPAKPRLEFLIATSTRVCIFLAFSASTSGALVAPGSQRRVCDCRSHCAPLLTLIKLL